MNLLLDTHALLWWLNDHPRLGARARAAISEPECAVWVSAASVWEIVIKAGIGRLDLAEPPEAWLPSELERNGFRPLAITVPHVVAVAALPQIHGDPFDRVLVAQARVEALHIVTCDALVARYDVPVLAADA